MSEQLKAATGRAAIAMIVAALVALNAYLIGDTDARMAIGGFTIALSAIFTRVGEGLYDQQRAESGNVKPGDVHSLP